MYTIPNSDAMQLLNERIASEQQRRITLDMPPFTTMLVGYGIWNDLRMSNRMRSFCFGGVYAGIVIKYNRELNQFDIEYKE